MGILEEIFAILPVGILVYEGKDLLFVNSKFKDIFQKKGDNEENAINHFMQELNNNTTKSNARISYNQKTLLVAVKLIESYSIYCITDITVVNMLNIKEIQDEFKGKLILAFTHEFRTPLNWLAGSISSIDATNENRETILMASHAIDLLSFYINNMIDFNLSKEEIQLKTEEPFSISKSIKECMDFLKCDFQFNEISCSVYVSNEIPVCIKGDPTRYKQIFINIINNCIKSAQNGHGNISISAEIRSNKVYTLITDNGKQMNDNELNMLLTPLEATTDSNCLQTRFGLGMILCRSMCQKCGGDLSINSYPDGNMYTFNIPLEILSQHESMCNQECVEEQKSSPKRNVSIIPQKVLEQCAQFNEGNSQSDLIKKSNPLVLLVDDTPFNNAVLKKILDKLEIDTCVCTNGLEAVEQVKVMRFDMILMDINMPVMDGIEVSV